MTHEFMKDSRYIQIVKDFNKQVKKINEKVKADVKDETVKAEVTAAKKATLGKINDFYSAKSKEYADQRESIERAYKNRKQSYTNPQAELLARQDFDMKVQVASNSDLENMLKDEQLDLNEYQFNRLHMEFKSREMKDADFSYIRTAKNIGREHLSDPNYIKAAEAEKYLYLTRPNGENTTLWYATDDRPRGISINELSNAARVNFNENNLKEIEEGVKLLEQSSREQNEHSASFNPIVIKEAEKYADNAIEQGKPLNFKEYKDIDPRAIEGTKEYNVTDEFKYLKERYHDDTNTLYHLTDDNYSVVKHMAYLRSKHAEHLDAHPDIKKQTEQVTQQAEPVTSDE